ncbi:MAG: Argininosuccinate synthase [uncultured Thermomicrobiales bacterium]|uniref:Argininosuccinate synthase n=1 Tax=uncultured Thermomicrobiales bacterium TaxID=1645740 RepID=A0A6J4UHQ7_9BACT|nr:MAG: Argininosuccinate synthase [uncultured Thermomicrobiales bacterium]
MTSPAAANAPTNASLVAPFTFERTPTKVALAYSGGLDTSCIIPWLKEQFGEDCEVVAVAADLGQPDDLSGVEAKAIASGASACHILDLRETFLTDYVFPTLRAGAIYERKYLLGTSMARPLIARQQVEIAQLVGADALAHGCTGKGNDQVRFELTYQALAPEMTIVAPWRHWHIRSREDAIDYARDHGVPVAATTSKIYSVDGNLWHLSHEGGALEDPWNEPPADAYGLTVSPEDAPDTPEYVTIGFERGWPVSVDGRATGPVEMVETLNALGGAHGVGRVDLLENRLVGMKSRGIYETPGGTLLMTAHRELEHLVLDKLTMRQKDSLAQTYAELVYDGLWFTPLRAALDAFVDATQEPVTGEVRLKLYKGNATGVGVRSPNGLYQEDLATFGADDVYRQLDAEGFIRLFGLGQKVAARRDQRMRQEQGSEAVR